MADAMEPPKEDFSVGPLSVLSESVKKNCQVYTGQCGGMHVLEVALPHCRRAAGLGETGMQFVR